MSLHQIVSCSESHRKSKCKKSYFHASQGLELVCRNLWRKRQRNIYCGYETEKVQGYRKALRSTPRKFLANLKTSCANFAYKRNRTNVFYNYKSEVNKNLLKSQIPSLDFGVQSGLININLAYWNFLS
jgi:hypothetical protein